MKKILALVLCLAVVASALAESETCYRLNGRVIDVDWDDECVTILDENGMQWYWMDDPDDWEYGDMVEMRIDSEGTESPWDDTLLEVTYLEGSA